MQPFIRMLQEAGEDENVVSIKMTLYRVAKNSQIVESLISAAENGKEVVVLVELRARFDEEKILNGREDLKMQAAELSMDWIIQKYILNSVL